MKKNRLTIILFLFISNIIISQNADLSFLSIPDSLKTNANAVIRYDHTKIEILSQSKMTYHKKMAVTVLNELGDPDGHITLHYDNHQKIKSVSAKILDAFGKEIKKIKRSDFEDVSAVDDISLFSDNRLYYYQYNPLKYPYTIVYEYETSTSSTVFIPTWYPIKFYHASTMESTFEIHSPEEIILRSKEFNLSNWGIINNSSKSHVLYSIKNARAYDYEPLSPTYTDFGPHVRFNINKFSLAGEDGEAKNWSDFGAWWHNRLLSGRDKVSEKTKYEILKLVEETEDPKEKSELIYKYMQNKTRYISVQIGIGGWKPITAMEVDELGYGDCKALTNYTKALLKVADIPSYYSRIYAGEGDRKYIDPEFVSQQTNHAILMVPFEKDTVWLECTNQKAPFGHLGSFTDDRDAIVITPQGGKIVRTKTYENTDNTQDISGELSIKSDGNIAANLKIVSAGIQYDDNYHIAYMDDDKKDSYYKSFFDEINNLQLKKIEVFNDEKEAKFIEDIEFTAENYSVNSGDKMLVRLNIVNTSQYIPKRIRNRKLPLEIQYGFVDTDDIKINLPPDYEIEAMGEPKVLETKFGTYKIEIEQLNDKQLMYRRTLLIKRGVYTVADYNNYRKFRKKINQLDNLKIVLSKSEQL